VQQDCCIDNCCIDCIDNGQKCEVSGAVMRYIVTGGILLATLGWLVLSYLPESTAALPQVAFTGALAQSALPWLAGATLLVFLAIQTDLVRATARWFGPAATPTTVRAAREFNLQRGIETFWTVLPLLGTLLLGFWLVIVG
jgi:hypothetical protein